MYKEKKGLESNITIKKKTHMVELMTSNYNVFLSFYVDTIANENIRVYVLQNYYS